MTREAKIGLLTGLGVIVLIGVLLSNYLGQNPSPRMAVLPIGQSYRDQVTRPLNVPDASANAGYRGDQTPPPAYAVRDNTVSTPDMNGSVPGQPLVAAPVTPVNDGRVLGDARSPGDGLPTFKLADGAPVSVVNAGTTNKAPAVTGKEHVIAQGDTLAKIAAKYYKTATATNEQKIVAANPAMLKNVGSMLTIGKKLIIPDVPVAVSSDAGKKPDVRVAKGPTVLIHPPGVDGGIVSDNKTSDPRLVTVKPDAPKAEAPKSSVYVVKSGDTLGLIAAQYLGTGDKTEAAKMVSKIVSLNKIKEPGSLQVGMKLKLPAKA